jgi:hypothetical protein
LSGEGSDPAAAPRRPTPRADIAALPEFVTRVGRAVAAKPRGTKA